MIKIEAIIKPEKATSIGIALEDAGVGGYFFQTLLVKVIKKVLKLQLEEEQLK